MTARVHHVLKARKDNKAAGIKKGMSYYWWKFRFGGKHFSLTPPTRSQLTQSEWLSQAYDIDDSIAALTPDSSPEEIKSAIDEAVSQLQDLQSEAEDRLSSMPEQLQESSQSGQTLQEYIDQFQDWASTLEGIDVPDDEEPVEPDDPGEEPEEPVREDFDDDDDYAIAVREYQEEHDTWETQTTAYEEWEEAHSEWISGIESALDEAQSACPF